jgi:MFS family permease
MPKSADPGNTAITAPARACLAAGDDRTEGVGRSNQRRYGLKTLITAPSALALLSASIVARFPLAMLSISLLVYAQRLTGSFAVAGLVSGSYTAGLGISAPALGRLADRRGQPGVLLTTASASAVLLGVLALLPATVPGPVLMALAAGTGLATPPLSGCTRALLPGLLPDAEALPAAYPVESAALELTFIFGPPLALGLATLGSPRAPLACAGLTLLAATAAFATQPASRRWRPLPATRRQRGGSLQAPAIRTLAAVLAAVGVLFGATEVGVTAAATRLGSTGSAGPLLALWGLGSLAGGMAATRRGGSARTAAGLALILATLALGHAALAVATSSRLALGAVLLVAGAAIAPAYASIHAIADHAARGLDITKVAAYEPTYVIEGTRPRPADDLAGQLRALLGQGDRDEAVAMFQAEAVGLPAQIIDGMRTSPMWGWFTALAQTLPYDVILAGPGMRLPAERFAAIRVPVLAIGGGASPPWLPAADAIPGARYVTLDGHDHGVLQQPSALRPLLTRYFGTSE